MKNKNYLDNYLDGTIYSAGESKGLWVKMVAGVKDKGIPFALATAMTLNFVSMANAAEKAIDETQTKVQITSASADLVAVFQLLQGKKPIEKLETTDASSDKQLTHDQKRIAGIMALENLPANPGKGKELSDIAKSAENVYSIPDYKQIPTPRIKPAMFKTEVKSEVGKERYSVSYQEIDRRIEVASLLEFKADLVNTVLANFAAQGVDWHSKIPAVEKMVDHHSEVVRRYYEAKINSNSMVGSITTNYKGTTIVHDGKIGYSIVKNVGGRIVAGFKDDGKVNPDIPNSETQNHLEILAQGINPVNNPIVINVLDSINNTLLKFTSAGQDYNSGSNFDNNRNQVR